MGKIQNSVEWCHGQRCLPVQSLVKISQTIVVSPSDRFCKQEAGIGFEQDAMGLTMTELKLKAITDYGTSITNSLKELEPGFHCKCRPEEACTIEITELPGSRFEAVVTMPRPVQDAQDWTIHPGTSGVYRRTFDKRATVDQIQQSVAGIVGAEMRDTDLASGSESSGELIVVVDPATLQKAQNLIVGCAQCTQLPEIPFKCILDSVTNSDPTATQYILTAGSAICPRCGRSITVDTLVKFQPLDHDE